MQAPPRYSSQETIDKGRQWYETSIRQQVDTEANIGKIVAIDVETGEYALGVDQVAALTAIRQRVPNPFLCFLRIGYMTPTKVGGALQREAKQ